MKRTVALVLALLSLALLVPAAAAADETAVAAGEERVSIGADLSEGQRLQIYADFGIEPGSVRELRVTNGEERSYLQGLVPEGKIGNVALSCLYIKTLEPGAGLTISSLKNINWCTEATYTAALLTAGITDAEIRISAPFAVSGTAALTSAYKVYEDITGTSLNMAAKEASVLELVVTGNLAELLGDLDATTLVNELKGLLDVTQDMTDDQLREEILNIAKAMDIALTEGQVNELISLCRKFEKMDTAALTQQFESFKKTVTGLQKTTTALNEFGQKVKTFFENVGNFFKNLFQ